MNGDETFQMEISGTRMMPNTNLNNTAELSEEEKEGGGKSLDQLSIFIVNNCFGSDFQMLKSS